MQSAKIFRALVSRSFGHGQHPAHFAAALLGVDEIGDGHNLQPAFHDPVESGQPRIEHAVFDVPGHLLRPNQHALDIGIGRARGIRPAVGVDVESGARKQLQRRLLQTAFRNTNAQLHGNDPSDLSRLPLRKGKTLGEAGPRSVVADHAFAQHSHLQQNGVAIAVGRSRDHFQPVAGGLTLGPKLVAGAAEKRDVAGPQRLFERLAIHEAQHQHLAAGCILHDGGQQPCILSKSISWFMSVLIHDLLRICAPETKSPLSRYRVSGPNLCE